MLNLLIADNLFQVFISWELVGVCSFFLIGFYFERTSASTAANKAFIMNRIGDVGFVIGLAIVWTYFGTFNFEEVQAKLRCPVADTHGEGSPTDMAGTIVRGNRLPKEPDKPQKVQISPKGKEVLLFPDHWHAGACERRGRRLGRQWNGIAISRRFPTGCWWSRVSASFSVAWANRHNSRCILGCPTRWKALRLSVP